MENLTKLSQKWWDASKQALWLNQINWKSYSKFPAGENRIKADGPQMEMLPYLVSLPFMASKLIWRQHLPAMNEEIQLICFSGHSHKLWYIVKGKLLFRSKNIEISNVILHFSVSLFICKTFFLFVVRCEMLQLQRRCRLQSLPILFQMPRCFSFFDVPQKNSFRQGISGIGLNPHRANSHIVSSCVQFCRCILVLYGSKFSRGKCSDDQHHTQTLHLHTDTHTRPRAPKRRLLELPVPYKNVIVGFSQWSELI